MKALLLLLLGVCIFTFCGVHVLDHRTSPDLKPLWVIGTACGSFLALYGLIANHHDHTRRR